MVSLTLLGRLPLLAVVAGALMSAAAGSAMPDSPQRSPRGAMGTEIAHRSCAQGPRPITGWMLKRADERGGGKLEIDNRISEDAVIQLVRDRRTFLAVYVRANREYTVSRIPDGRYGVYWTLGSAKAGVIRSAGWDSKLLRVMCPTESKREQNKLEFTTERTQSGVTYSRWHVTLYVSAGGGSGRHVTPPPL